MNKKKTMRITGGKLVRRLFFLPSLVDEGIVRPTPDRVRESLFAFLSPYLVNAKVLDLFSGSGAHAFECVSRGAKDVTLIENNLSIKKTIEENIKKLSLENSCRVILIDAIEFIKNNNELYDIIFIDPPYSLSLPKDFFPKSKKCLNKNGLIVFRCFKKSPLLFGDDLEILKDKVYGGTRVLLLSPKS